MADDPATAPRSGRRVARKGADLRMNAARGGRRRRTVRFGNVTLTVDAPPQAEIDRNIERGRQALARGLKRFLKPGIRLRAQRGVPLFHADPDHPGFLIRTLDGVVERGVIENGVFKVTG
jgi:hypothetical protein